ncbi:MAG: MFS transporter, partial [Candidatus Eremiobacteraeota bacterium]|nr:MFS transporter [Candidatus Eremiobacteraeota bacterium]
MSAPQSARWILTATILGSSLVFIDGAVVSIALPIVQRQFNASAAQTQWIVEAYTLVLGALMLLAGALADRYGRKRIFMLGTAIFAIASLACGLAPSLATLIGARVIQGLGGTLLAPASLALIGAHFRGAERSRAIGTWSGMSAVAAAVGPVAGGAIIDHFGWRWVFFINLPLAAAVVALAWRHLEESRDDEARRGRLDVLGSACVTLALGLIVYAFIAGPYYLLVPGAAFFALFLWIEHRVPEPVMPLGLFANAEFSGINAMTFLLYGALSALFYYMPFIMIQVDGYSAAFAGAAFLPFVALMVLLSRASGTYSARFGVRPFLTAGPILTALGFAAFAFLPDLHYWQGVLPAIVLIGIGMGLTVAPLTTTVIGSVPEHNVGVASGINNAVSRIAGLLAIAAFGALIAWGFNARLDALLAATPLTHTQRTELDRARPQMAAGHVSSLRERALLSAAFERGFRYVALGCALLAAGSAITAALTLRGAP